MTPQQDYLSSFREAYLDYLEGDRDTPPAVDELPTEHRRAAQAFIQSITAARGIDPYASRPSIERLLTRRSRTAERTDELNEVLQDHLRLTVDRRASVTADVASVAAGLASASVIQARGMRIRVVPETDSADLEYAISGRAEDIARVFSAFPDSHAVLYTTTGREYLGVLVDRGDVYRAIETPSGERRAPRLRRSVTDAATACEDWITGIMPGFRPFRTGLPEPATASKSAIDPFQLAYEVVGEVSQAGGRARIQAKRATWRDFGAEEAERLAAMVLQAQRGELSEEVYRSYVDELGGRAA